MKSTLTVFALLIFFQATAFSKVVMIDDKVYLRNEGKKIPVFLVNNLIEKKKVKEIHLYGDGKVHLISFSIPNEKEMLYSIDDQGLIYAIEPFSNYSVNKITEAGEFQFRQAPGKYYRVTKEGYFVY